MKNSIGWLRLSYWSGAIIDALAGILLTFPLLNSWLTGITPTVSSAAYRASNTPAAALMWGWTALLIWADRRPLARRGVLILTLFPVLTWMISARICEVWVYHAPFQQHLPFFILQFSLVILLTYSLWVSRNEKII
ncbi:MAG: hypothetical protein LWX83_06280 [Anaerolineae bacterium]|nr:hypothetical protein [Anaerolineae bacterium]